MRSSDLVVRDQRPAILGVGGRMSSAPFIEVGMPQLLAQLEPDGRLAFVVAQMLRLTFETAAVRWSDGARSDHVSHCCAMT